MNDLFSAHTGNLASEGLSVTVELIGPDLARRYLAFNTKNRPLSPTRVASYKKDMQSGFWPLTHQGICFGEDGRLIDGQHRLAAVVESGVAAKFLVTRGAKNDTFSVVDKGYIRRSGQIFSMMGIKSPNVVAAAMNLLGSYILSPKSVGYGGWSLTLTTKQIESVINTNMGITGSVSAVYSLGLKKLGEESVFAFCHYVFSVEDKDKAASFFESLSTGIGLSKRHPVYLLRERLITVKSSSKMKSVKMKRGYKISLIFKAFRAYMDGARLGVLRLNEGEQLQHNEIVRDLLLEQSGIR